MDAHPEISLNNDASAAQVDFDNESIDIALRHFKLQNRNRFDVELLFLDELRVYCSPVYCEKLELKKSTNLAKTTLLLTKIHPYWEHWRLHFTKLSAREIDEVPAINFDASHLAVDTAKRHQGLVLTSTSLVEHEIESGELIEPFEGRLPVDEGYYLVAPKGSFAQGGAVEALKFWLRQACRVSL